MAKTSRREATANLDDEVRFWQMSDFPRGLVLAIASTSSAGLVATR
jgi:hypothetical protein